MPFSEPTVCALTRARSPTVIVTPSIEAPGDERLRLVWDATRQESFHANPSTAELRSARRAGSSAVTGDGRLRMRATPPKSRSESCQPGNRDGESDNELVHTRVHHIGLDLVAAAVDNRHGGSQPEVVVDDPGGRCRRLGVQIRHAAAATCWFASGQLVDGRYEIALGRGAETIHRPGARVDLLE